MMSVVAKTLLNLAQTWASMRDRKTAYFVSDNGIEVKFVNPDNMERYHWDDDLYSNGNLYISGQANPIKPTVDEEKDEVDVITSSKYKAFMKQNVIDEAFNTSGDDLPLQLYVQAAILVVVIFGLVMYFG